MFGLFKKQEPAEPDRSKIVPRIKHLNFLSALADRGVPADQQPLTEQLVADLLVTYAFDLPDMFQMVRPVDIDRLSIPPRELRAMAVNNFRRQVPKIGTRVSGPVIQVVTGDNLEACTLLADKFWENVSREVPGRTVVSVPSRDVVLFCSSESTKGLDVMAKVAVEVFERESTHALTHKFLTWYDGVWSEYVA